MREQRIQRLRLIARREHRAPDKTPQILAFIKQRLKPHEVAFDRFQLRLLLGQLE